MHLIALVKLASYEVLINSIIFLIFQFEKMKLREDKKLAEKELFEQVPLISGPVLFLLITLDFNMPAHSGTLQ